MIGTVSQVQDRIRSFADPRFERFSDWPVSITDAIEKWTTVADVLMAQVIPASVTTPQARAAFKAELAQWSNQTYGVYMLQRAFHAYAIALAPGMVASQYNGIPPPVEPFFSLTGLQTRSAEIETAKLAAVLVPWAHTGTAVHLIEPFETIPWT